MVSDIIPVYRMYGQNATGTIYPIITNDSGQLKVDTELDFSSGTIIGNVYCFKDGSGNAEYALVDNSRQIILSPSSTIILGNNASNAGTIAAFQFTSPWVVSGTINVAGGSGTIDVRLALNSGTIQVGNSISNAGTISALISNTGTFVIGNTTGTIQIGNTSSNSGTISVLGNTTPADGLSNPTNATNGNCLTNVFNGSSWDRIRSATQLSGSTITPTGLLAVANMRFDGTNWRPMQSGVSTATSGTCLNYTTSASTALASAVGRQYSLLRNASSNTVYMGFGRVPSTINFDTFLNQNDAYESNASNIWTGDINIIGSNTGTISVLSW